MSMSEAVTNNSIQPISSGAVYNALKVNTHTYLLNAATMENTSVISIYSVGNLVTINLAIHPKSGYPLDGWQATLIATQLPLPLAQATSILQAQNETPYTVCAILETNGYLSIHAYGQTNLPKNIWYRGQMTYVMASTSS